MSSHKNNVAFSQMFKGHFSILASKMRQFSLKFKNISKSKNSSHFSMPVMQLWLCFMSTLFALTAKLDFFIDGIF